MNDAVKLEDILFVFGKWTLMLKSNRCDVLVPGEEVELLDENGKKVGDASLGRYLNSRNPEISAIEINGKEMTSDMKSVKYVMPKRH